MVGAVNTVIIYPSRKTIGDNTDIFGFVSSFDEEDKTFLKGKNAAIIGAGGASRAVGAGLIKMGLSKIDLYDIQIENAQGTYKQLSKYAGKDTIITTNNIQNLNLDNVHLLVNASPVGMFPDNHLSPIDLKIFDKLDKQCIVYDLIYRPQQTQFLRHAKINKLKIYNGVEMLLRQGAKSLEIWTGEKAPIDVMRKSLLEVLKDEW